MIMSGVNSLTGTAVALIPGFCTLCRSRCGALYDVDQGRLIKVLPLDKHPTGGALCAKGRAAPEHVMNPLRLTKPLRRTQPRDADDAGWIEIPWDEALSEIALNLSKARQTYGAESVAFSVTTPSGTPMIDSFEWVERFIRCYGSPNLIYAIEVCGWHKDYAHALTYGRGIGVPDFEHSDTIVLWGHNPARTWLKQATRIANARRHGAKVIVVDPKISGSGQEADLWMRILPGSDAALALGAIRHLITSGTYDHPFVARWTNAAMLVNLASGRLLQATDIWPDSAPGTLVASNGKGQPTPFPSSSLHADEVCLDTTGTLLDRQGQPCTFASVFHLLHQHVQSYTVEAVAQITSLSEEDIARFNTMFENAPRLSYHSWTGVGQHSNATQTDRAIGTLYALTGACDRKGGNLWTVAPPYRAVNIYHDLLEPTQRAKALGLQNLPLGPPRLGFITARDFAAAVLAHDPYPVTMLMSFGSNMPVSQADTVRNMKALQALEFHAHVDMYLNPMAENADIVLPANMPWEREALRCGFEVSQAAVEHVQLRKRAVEPLNDTRSDYDIVFDLACRLGMNDYFFDGDVEAGWNYQLEPLGITVDDLRQHPEGLQFPQPFRYEKYTELDAKGKARGFPTPSGLIELYSEQLLDAGHHALPSYVYPASLDVKHSRDRVFPLILSTAKNGWFIHSSHRHIASLRKKAPYPQATISPTLASHHGLAAGDWLYVITEYGRVALQTSIDPHLHEQVVIVDFGWWQGCEPLGLNKSSTYGKGSFNINAILSDQHRDPVSGSVPMRAVACQIEAARTLNKGRWHGTRPFHVIEKTVLADDIVGVTLQPDDYGILPDFQPGQHVIVSTPDDALKRPYSLTGMHHRPPSLSIGVRLEHRQHQTAGRMSSYLHSLKKGDRLLLSMPSGTFTLPVSTSTRPVILGASGIGVTPFIGYLKALLTIPEKDRPPHITLIYVCRDSQAHPYRDTLNRLTAALPELRIIVLYRRPLATDRPGIDYHASHTLRFDWLDNELIAQRPLVYLCGSRRFINALSTAVIAQGIFDFDIFSEVFSTTVQIPPNLSNQTISVQHENQNFTWTPDDGTILNASEKAGIQLASGCRVGQCESCLTEVVSGKIAHLIPYEGPEGHCLTCQAVPLTSLVLKR